MNYFFSSFSDTNWIAPQNVCLPDFIMCGAMKSGTSTLHYILNQHPNVFIPKREIGFFDIDNIFEHPDYSHFDGNNWITHDIDSNPEKFWDWYSSHFNNAKPTDIIGEDSTTYFSSKIAAKRLSLQSKDIKLIVLLRQPTIRAYSQFWHLVRTGRAKYDFERTILHNPWSVLYRSLYLEHLNVLFKHINKENIKVVIFEEFIKDKQNVLKDLCSFINVDYDLLPTSSLNAHVNKTRIPKFPSLQILKNRIFPELSKKVNTQLPYDISHKTMSYSLIKFLHKKVNPHIETKLPSINPSTKVFLDNFFSKELDGLNEVMHKDVLSLWFDPYNY